MNNQKETERYECEGICPNCGNPDICFVRENSDITGDEISHPFECGNCRTKGKEIWILRYSETILTEKT